MCCGVSKYCEKKKMIANNLEKRKKMGKITGSVVDPNTLNLDLDPGFWPKLNPDPGLYFQL